MKNVINTKRAAYVLLFIFVFPITMFAQITDMAGLIKRADAGDADAQYQVGRCYISGNGMEQDYANAFKYAQLSANQNYAQGENLLGLCY